MPYLCRICELFGSVRPVNDRPISLFSQRLAAALRGYIRENGIRQSDVAERSGRSVGFVSARLTGHAPVDSDILDATAELAHVSTRQLVDELNRRAEERPRDGGGEQESPEAAAARIAAEARRARDERRKPPPQGSQRPQSAAGP